MTDYTPSRPGLKQGNSDNRELFLELFGMEVFTAYHKQLVFRDKHIVKTITNGKSYRFPAIWTASAAYHTVGAEITGGSIAHTEITITSDDKLVSSVFVGDIDEVMNHYDVRGPYAVELGDALAKSYDKQVLRSIILAARGGALFSGDQGGSALTLASYATDAGDLFDGLSDAKMTMDNKDVPIDRFPVYAALANAQYYLLARSDKNLNRDFGGQGNLASQQLRTVDDITIVKSNNTVFGVNDSSNTDIPSRYRANWTNTVSVVWTPYAAATLEVQGLSSQIVDQPERQGTLMIARAMNGSQKLRTKCAVELKVA